MNAPSSKCGARAICGFGGAILCHKHAKSGAWRYTQLPNVPMCRHGSVSSSIAGFLAGGSPFVRHLAFAEWVQNNEARFRAVLGEGERLCGEWLALAHGTIYDLPHEPFVAFDLMRGETRTTLDELLGRLHGDFITPRELHRGGAFSVEQMLEHLEPSDHGARHGVEGAVRRVERFDPKRKIKVVEFLSKYGRVDKVEGKYLLRDDERRNPRFGCGRHKNRAHNGASFVSLRETP